jgi:hypothetical protein
MGAITSKPTSDGGTDTSHCLDFLDELPAGIRTISG